MHASEQSHDYELIASDSFLELGKMGFIKHIMQMRKLRHIQDKRPRSPSW